MELKTYWSGGNCEGEKVVNAKQPKEDHLQLLSWPPPLEKITK